MTDYQIFRNIHKHISLNELEKQQISTASTVTDVQKKSASYLGVTPEFLSSVKKK